MKKPPRPIFAVRLQEAREAAAITKNALAVQAGVDPTFVGNLEAGRKAPSLAIAVKLADALGVSLDFLAGRDGK